MRYKFRQWMGVALATLFLLSGATARVRAQTLTATLTTTKGCGSNITYNIGDAFQILFQTNMNATATLTLQRPDGTFTVFNNTALQANVPYSLDRTVSATDAQSTTCGNRTLTLTVMANSQTVTQTCIYTISCGGGAIAADVHTDQGCGTSASYNSGATAQVFVQVGQTATATLTDIWPDGTVHTIFQNATLNGGVQYFVTGGLDTSTLPAGSHTLSLHAVSTANAALTGDATCTFSVGQGLPRATTDQLDDTTGYQIHVVYVLPSDGIDEKLDIKGNLSRSVAMWEDWLAGQTGGRRMRLDTFRGALDVTFFRLSRTDAQIRSYAGFVRDQIEYELWAAGFNQPNKIYAVYYGGSSSDSCGGGSWPPALLGNVAALYLKGTPSGAPPCASEPLPATTPTPGYWEFAMIHEIMHALGFVAMCAPHQTLSGHVSDDPRDLMYTGPLPWQPSFLDVGHDDYFQHHNAGCLDLATSAFLDPLPANTTLPPSWPLLESQPLDCRIEPWMRSLESKTATSIQFVNASAEIRQVYWLDFNGNRQLHATLQPWQIYIQSTFLTHPWAVTNAAGQCRGFYLPVDPPSRAMLR